MLIFNFVLYCVRRARGARTAQSSIKLMTNSSENGYIHQFGFINTWFRKVRVEINRWVGYHPTLGGRNPGIAYPKIGVRTCSVIPKVSDEEILIVHSINLKSSKAYYWVNFLSEGALLNVRFISFWWLCFFAFLYRRLHDFLYDVFRLQGKTGKTKIINT